MPLIKCPECNNDVSDVAVSCPKCGYPIKDNLTISIKTKSSNIVSSSPIPEKMEENQQKNLNKEDNLGCIIFFILIGVIIVVFIVGKCSSDTNTPSSNSSEIDSASMYIDSVKNAAYKINPKRVDSLAKAEELEFKKKHPKAYKINKKHPEWSKEDCISLSEGKIWIGMDYDMLVYMWGKPDSINSSNYGDGVQYQACWHGNTMSCFYFGEDNIITSYN